MLSRQLHPGGGTHPQKLPDGGWGHRGVDHPGLGGICKEGGPHSSNRRGRHSGPSPCGHFWRSTGPLCSPHLVPWPVAESVVGYAQHLLLLTTKLSTAKAESIREHQPSYAVRPVHRRATTPSLRRDIRHYPREQEDITFHHAWAEGLRWMREDVDVEVQAEQVLVAQPQHNKEVE